MIRPGASWRSLQNSLDELGRDGLRSSVGWGLGWWRTVRAGALVGVLALSPSTYTRTQRAALARHVYRGTAPVLPWFALLSALISVVLIRIVVVTAVSYGLSQYALVLVIRVLVLELIPLTAALFVALRCTLPAGAELIAMRLRGTFGRERAEGLDPLRHELLPRVLAGVFAVLMLAAVSCLLAMVLAYFAVYGFNVGGLAGYTRTLGQIFDPAVTMILVLKTLFFSLAVALIPVAAFLRGVGVRAEVADLASPASATPLSSPTSPELEGLVRLFAAILVIEVISLMSNYS